MLLLIRTKHSGKKAISRASPIPCAKAASRSCSDSELRKDSRCWISGVAMARRLCLRRNSVQTWWASISRGTWSTLGTSAPQEHGLTNLKFQEGDASNLEQVPDKTFDLVVSIFGAMFAPKPFDVAKEMVRVTRPGGRIVMGNWIPNDPTLVAQILKISSNYTPPPPEGFVSPMTWGVESNVIERFTAAGIPKDNISFARDTFTFNFPGTPSQLVDEFRKYYGPTMNAFEAAEKQGRAAELQKQLEDLFNSQNKSQEGTSIPATFLRVTVERK